LGCGCRNSQFNLRIPAPGKYSIIQALADFMASPPASLVTSSKVLKYNLYYCDMETTADEITGKATGALVFAVFGSAWLGLWLAGTKHLTAVTSSGLVLGALALVLTGAWVLRQSKQLPAPAPSPERRARRQRERRVFNWVNAGQWGVLILLGWLLPRIGYRQVGVPAAVFVVGLHLFPLAQLFSYRLLHVTGGALVAWALGCLLLGHQPALQFQAALGAGLILWVSATYALWLLVRDLQKR
jgi:hypothetical protein